MRSYIRNDTTVTFHGGSRTRLYQTWRDMRQRCENPRNRQYRLYGGKGVTVCDEWQSFDGFRTWAHANGYRDDLTIDRIDSGGGYEPHNCRWITNSENAGRAFRTKHRAKVTPDQVREIRQRCGNGESQRSVGHDFGLSQSAVSFIVRRECWTDVT